MIHSNPITKITSTANIAKMKPSSPAYQAGVLYDGTYTVCSIDSMESLHTLIKGIGIKDALVLGVPKNGTYTGTISSKSNFYADPNSIRRDKEHFGWSTEGNGFLLIDIDHNPELELGLDDVNKVRDYLISLDPRLEKVGMLVLPSASQRYDLSNKSWHVYIKCSNMDHLSVTNYRDALQGITWLKGDGFIKISKAGTMLVRQSFDAAVFSPERLVIESVFSSDENVEFHDIAPLVQEGEALDLSKQLEFDHTKMERLIEVAKINKQSEAFRIRKRYEATKEKELVAQGHDPIEAKKMLKKMYRDLILPANYIVHLSKPIDGKSSYPASYIKTFSERFAGVYCMDPYSPEDGVQKAMITSKGDIYSYKHGGYLIKLEPQFKDILAKVEQLPRAQSIEESEKLLQTIKSLSAQAQLSNEIAKLIAKELKSKGYIHSIVEFKVIPKDRYERDSNGKALATDTNLAILLDKYGFEVYYDVIKKEIIVKHEELDPKNHNIFDSTISLVKSYALREGLSSKIADDHLKAIAMNRYRVNPLTTMVEEAMALYDGVDYIRLIAKALVLTKDKNTQIDGCSDEEYLYEIIKRWAIEAVAAWYHDLEVYVNPDAKLKFENVLVLLGRQGLNKTNFLSNLLNFKGFNKYFKEGIKLEPANKDSVKQVVSYGIVELGELDATFRKSDIAELKAFFSNTIDEIRLVYDKDFSKYERQTVFAASVNERYFLSDTTGNRRYWVLDLEKIDFRAIKQIDMEKFWGQIGHLFFQGHKWWFDPNDPNDVRFIKKIEAVHSQHRMIKVEEDYATMMYEAIQRAEKMPSSLKKQISPTALLRMLGVNSPTAAQVANFKNALEKYGITPNKSGQYYLPIDNIGNNIPSTTYTPLSYHR